MTTKDELLTEVMDRNFDLSKDNQNLKDQIKELEEKLDKANAQLQKGNIPNVMGCLQEKKKAWIGKQKIYLRDEKALKETAKDYQTRRLFLIELINLTEAAINDLEEIINKNSP